MQMEPLGLQRLRYQISALSLILSQSLLAYVAVVVNVAVYAGLSWLIVPTTPLLIWVAASLALAVFRWNCQRRWLKVLQNFSKDDIRHKFMCLYMGIGLSALLWGIMASVFLVPESSLHLAVTVFIIAGLSSGAVGAYAVNLRLTYVFLMLSVGPLIGRLLYENQAQYLMMAGLASLYLVLMMLVARNVHRQTLRSVELGLQNEELIHKLGDASHEIRAPVSNIAGFAAELEGLAGADETVKHYAQVIRRNSDYLKKLVDNVLLLSRADLGAMEENPELVNLNDQIKIATDMVAEKLREKNLELTICHSSGTPERACLQALKVQQILINLLSNAVKFTDRGQITLSTSLSDQQELVISVADTGIGVSPENLARIFQPFWREKRAAGQEGAGLGLALSRSLAKSMGGDLILLSSAPGTGSVFELRIPDV